MKDLTTGKIHPTRRFRETRQARYAREGVDLRRCFLDERHALRAVLDVWAADHPEAADALAEHLSSQ